MRHIRFLYAVFQLEHYARNHRSPEGISHWGLPELKCSHWNTGFNPPGKNPGLN